METWARVRDDLLQEGEYPPCSQAIDKPLWSGKFLVCENPCEDFETIEGFNMIIQHPLTLEKVFVCSIDFDFI